MENRGDAAAVESAGSGRDPRGNTTDGEIEDESKRGPTVIARLMGLESLPDAGAHQPRHRRSHSYTGGDSSCAGNVDSDRTIASHYGTPLVALEDLLKRDSNATTLRERMVGSARIDQKKYDNRFTKSKSSTALTALVRERREESCGTPGYIDIPEVQNRFLNTVAERSALKDRKHPHESSSRLPASPQYHRTSPLRPSKLHTPRQCPAMINLEDDGKIIPELSLPSSSRSLSILQAAGWPLAGRQRFLSIDSGENENTYFRSDQSSLHEGESNFRSASQPASKLLRERRKDESTWSGREGSESANEQVESDLRGSIALVRNSQRKNPRSGEGSIVKRAAALEIRLLQSLPSVGDRGNSRKSVSYDNISYHEDFISKNKISQRTSAHKAAQRKSLARACLSKTIVNDILLESIQGSNEGSPRRSSSASEGSSSSSSSSSSSLAPQISNLTADAEQTSSVRAIRTPKTRKAGRSDSSKLTSSKGSARPKNSVCCIRSPKMSFKKDEELAEKKSDRSVMAPYCYGQPSLDGYRAPKVKKDRETNFAQREFADGNLIPNSLSAGTNNSLDKLNSQTPEKARAIGNKQTTINTLAEIHGMIKTPIGSAPSIEVVAPSAIAPYDRLKMGNSKEMATSRSAAKSEGLNDESDASPRNFNKRSQDTRDPKHGIVLRATDVFSPPRASIDVFSSPRSSIDCNEPHYSAIHPPTIASSEVELQELEFAAGLGDLRWEDDTSEQRDEARLLTGGYCERITCSGPSISTESDKDDEIYRDEAWSSCASYNPVGCDSPKTFEIVETDTEPDFHEHKAAAAAFANRKTLEGCAESVDEAEQPSPVSILNSPFHDEACTTPESSHAGTNPNSDVCFSCHKRSKSISYLPRGTHFP